MEARRAGLRIQKELEVATTVRSIDLFRKSVRSESFPNCSGPLLLISGQWALH